MNFSVLYRAILDQMMIAEALDKAYWKSLDELSYCMKQSTEREVWKRRKDMWSYQNIRNQAIKTDNNERDSTRAVHVTVLIPSEQSLLD